MSSLYPLFVDFRVSNQGSLGFVDSVSKLQKYSETSYMKHREVWGQNWVKIEILSQPSLALRMTYVASPPVGDNSDKNFCTVVLLSEAHKNPMI